MIIVGLDAVNCEVFSEISNVLGAENSMGTIWFETLADKNFELSGHCEKHALSYAVLLRNYDVTKLLIYAAKGAKYVLLTTGQHIHEIDTNMLKEFQNIAQNYLLDTKILYVIKDVQDIAHLAETGVDGVIFVDFLIKNLKASYEKH